MVAPKTGWIYVVTCDMYDHEGLLKMGYTEKPDMLEEQVRAALIQRYATTLINPRILTLVRVAHPKEAEKALFEKLKEKKHAKEVFKCVFDTDVKPVITWLATEFHPNEPYEIRMEVLEKLLCRLRKKNKVLVRDLSHQRRMFDHIQQHVNTLYPNNQEMMYNLMNRMPYPCVTRSNMEWYKIPENAHILSTRTSHADYIFTNPNNWNRKDPNLHSFLVRLLDNL